MEDELLWENANLVFRQTGTWGICVGAAEASVTEIANGMPYRGKWVRVAELGEVRRRGFDVVLLDDAPHAVLVLNAEPSGADWVSWEWLRGAFGEPLPNPRNEQGLG